MTDQPPAQRAKTEGNRSAAALEFRNVSKRYPGGDRPVLVDLSFEVPAG